MPMVRFSPAFVRHATCPADLKKIDYFDFIMVGFMLEVRSSGGKTYYQRYTDDRGRERQYKVGPADVLTLRQAKRKAMQIKAQAILGSDPQKDIRTEAGLSDVRLHDLRHTFASVLVNEGKQLYRVQRLLGHANAKATQRYAHLAPEALADAAEAMGNVVRPLLERASNARPKKIRVLRSDISQPKRP